MARDRKDRSANWIIEKHGISLLRLANVVGFTSWRPAQTVLTFPKQMPDGLLDLTFPDRPGPDPFLIEIESYPDQETAEQLRNDAMMVLQGRGVLPDILLVILSPKGNLEVEPEHEIHSVFGLTALRLRLRVLKLWTIPAEELLVTNDVGLIPWVPLTAYAGSPAALLQLCRERIEQQANPEERGNLLATTHVMAEIRYNDLDLFKILGEQPMKLEKILEASPSFRRFKAEATHQGAVKAKRSAILHWLERKFGPLTEDLAAHLQTVDDLAKLDRLLDAAFDAQTLDEFRIALEPRD